MVLNIGDSKQLFLEDKFIVESTVGIRRVMHHPKKHPENPLIVSDKPWEDFGVSVCSAIYDEEEKIYKMWYLAKPKPESSLLAYATSKDAIHWEKPILGVKEFEGSKENNTIFFYETWPISPTCVIKDSMEKDPDKRYKLIWIEEIPNTWPDTLWAAYSRDGIGWNVYPTPIWNDRKHFDADNVIFFDTSINRYVAYVRRWLEHDGKIEGGGGPAMKRHIGRMESDDFINWTTPEIVLGPDDNDPPDSDLYTPPAFKYAVAENAYFMLPSIFDWRRDQLWIQLATSRDGISWHRAGNREPFIPLGPPKAWDSEALYVSASPLILNDEIYFYYSGNNMGHDKWYTCDHEVFRRSYGIGVATLRLDGFISLDAGWTGGVVTTRPLRFEGSMLELNVEAPYGKVEVEILDEKGDKPMPGYAKDDCNKVSGDSVSHRVTWKEKDSLDDIVDETIRLRIYLQFARLYAFRFKKLS